MKTKATFQYSFLLVQGGQSERICNISSDKGILIPINVVGCSFAEFNVKTEEELHNCAEEDESSNPVLFLSVDGTEFKDLEEYRVHPEPLMLTFLMIPFSGQYQVLHVPYLMVIGLFLSHYQKENMIYITKEA